MQAVRPKRVSHPSPLYRKRHCAVDESFRPVTAQVFIRRCPEFHFVSSVVSYRSRSSPATLFCPSRTVSEPLLDVFSSELCVCVRAVSFSRPSRVQLEPSFLFSCTPAASELLQALAQTESSSLAILSHQAYFWPFHLFFL